MARILTTTLLQLLLFTAFQLSRAGENYKAQCMISAATGMSDEPVEGSIMFEQPMSGGDVTITLNLTGFDTADADTLHGFHVHAENDSTNNCVNMGGHFNPTGVNHGAPTNDASARHVGDLGNIMEDSNGNIASVFTDSIISLFGENSIIGKGIVVHEKEDDLGVNPNDQGSITTGNAGGRLGCCVIQLIRDPTVKMASCTVESGSGSSEEPVSGTVMFSQPEDSDTVTININLEGFDTTDSDTLHGFHVHEHGNTGNACMDMGGHFNPAGVNHGAPTSAVRHVGDLGNIEENSMGMVVHEFTDNVISLFGNNSNIINLGIVVHAKVDDLGVNTNDQGSITTGNAGGRLACCIIKETNSAFTSGSPHPLTSNLITLVLLPLLTWLLHH